MRVHVYVGLCVCMHMHVYAWCVYFICICMYVCVSTYMCVCVYVCCSISLSVCLCVSKDERGFPLTQYITNGRISRGGYTVTHFKHHHRVLRLISYRMGV